MAAAACYDFGAGSLSPESRGTRLRPYHHARAGHARLSLLFVALPSVQRSLVHAPIGFLIDCTLSAAMPSASTLSAARGGFRIRPATSEDAGSILQLIRGLAEYEKAPEEVLNTEEQLREDGWGKTPRFTVSQSTASATRTAQDTNCSGPSAVRCTLPQSCPPARLSPPTSHHVVLHRCLCCFLSVSHLTRFPFRSGTCVRSQAFVAELESDDSTAADSSAFPDSSSSSSSSSPSPSSGRCVAFALTYFAYSTWKGVCLYLEDIYVEPDYRGRGIGMALIRQCVEFAHGHGCQRVMWQALDWNQPAIDFYLGLGATIMKEWLSLRLTKDGIDAFRSRFDTHQQQQQQQKVSEADMATLS